MGLVGEITSIRDEVNTDSEEEPIKAEENLLDTPSSSASDFADSENVEVAEN